MLSFRVSINPIFKNVWLVCRVAAKTRRDQGRERVKKKRKVFEWVEVPIHSLKDAWYYRIKDKGFLVHLQIPRECR